MRAAMSAQRNKTDAADALGIAHIMRMGWFRQAHIKTKACYRMKLLLTHRRNLKRKFLDLENAVRQSLKRSASSSAARRTAPSTRRCARPWRTIR